MGTEHEPRLTTTDGESGESVVHSLADGVHLVGRARSNDIQLADTSVSRFHCRLERRGGEVRVFDTKSSNRTRVNANIADGRVLRDGDVLTLGRCRLVYRGPAPRPRAKASPGSAATGSLGRRRPEPGPRRSSRRPLPREAHLRATRDPLASPPAALAVVASAAVLLFGGWTISRALFWPGEERAAPAAAATTTTTATTPAGGAVEVLEVPRSREQLVGSDARLVAQSQHIEALRLEKLALEDRLSELKDVRARDDLLEEVLLELEVLQGKLSRSEEERNALEDRLRTRIRALDRGDRRASSRSEHRSRTEVASLAGEPAGSSPQIDGLVAQLVRVVEDYASPTTSPEDLQPALTALSESTGREAAAGVLSVYRHGARLLDHVERSVELNTRRRATLLAEARRLAPPGAAASEEESEYHPRRVAPDLELKQRELELGSKALEILEGQRARLDALLDAVAAAIAHLEDPAAVRVLSDDFPTARDARLRAAMATLFAEVRARRAVPALIRSLGAPDEKLREASHAALVAIAGEDLGTERTAWQKWWGAHRSGVEIDSVEDLEERELTVR